MSYRGSLLAAFVLVMAAHAHAHAQAKASSAHSRPAEPSPPAMDSALAAVTADWRRAVSSWFRWWTKERTFTLVDENDALARVPRSTDSAYTQGIRFRWDIGDWPKNRVFRKAFKFASLHPLIPDSDGREPDLECAAKGSRDDRPCGLVHLSINQTEYTPPELRNPNPDYTTRPYAGYLYASVGGTILYPHTSVTSELTIGTIGARSAARGTQSLAHWTWSSSATEPMGWHNQLRNAWQITLRNLYAVELLELCLHDCTTGTRDDGRIFDIVPNAELVLGTLMRRGSVGGSAHLGYGFPDLITPFRIATTAPPVSPDSQGVWDEIEAVVRTGWKTAWGMAFVSYDRRYVETNDLLTGSHNDDGPTGWRTNRRINLERDVGEYAWGVVVGIERLTIGWQRVTRSAEYRPGGGPHRFGVFTLGIFTPD